ncbi:MAG: hypothetical protein RUDDFDWM_001542 [Candidatus Fervidibacterota bacterium]
MPKGDRAHEPQRTCVGCKHIKAKDKLIRVAVLRNGEVVMDLKQSVGGRGAYICPMWECIVIAYKRKALEASLKRSIPNSIYIELLNNAQLATGDLWKPKGKR